METTPVRAAFKPFVQALKALKGAQFHEYSRWEWWSKERREEVRKLRHAIAEAQAWLKEAEPDPEAVDLLVSFDLALLESMLVKLDEAYRAADAKRPEALETIRQWSAFAGPQEMERRLENVKRALDGIIASGDPHRIGAYGFLRRKALALALTAGLATGASATLLRLFNHDPGTMQTIQTLGPVAQPTPTIIAPGFYIQLGASKNRAACEEYVQNLAGKGIKAVIFTASGNANEELQLKVIINDPAATFIDAAEMLSMYEQEHDLPPSIGIIKVENGFKTVWLKTIEYQVVARSEELQQSREPEAQRPFAKEIAAALRAHPLPHVDADRQPSLVRAMIEVESSNNPKAQSRRGAQGLMQLMPRTWNEQHSEKNARYHPRSSGKGASEAHACDVFDPMQNIDAGVNYLAWLFRTYYDHRLVKGDEQIILKMYNDGPGNVLERLEHDSPLPKETNQYPSKIQLAENLHK